MTVEEQASGARESGPTLGSENLAAAMVNLPREECLRLLAAQGFGRLAVAAAAGAPVIRPVNYIFDERSQSVMFRTSDGSKLHALLKAGEAAFEIDGIDEGSRTGWSVIVRGYAERVTNPMEVRRLDDLRMIPWAPGEKRHWVRIRARTVSGKRIVHSIPAAQSQQR